MSDFTHKFKTESDREMAPEPLHDHENDSNTKDIERGDAKASRQTQSLGQGDSSKKSTRARQNQARETGDSGKLGEQQGKEGAVEKIAPKLLKDYHPVVAKKVEKYTGVSVDDVLVEVDSSLSEKGQKGAARGSDWIGLSPESKGSEEVIIHEAVHSVQARGGSPEMEAKRSGVGLSVEDEAISATEALVAGQHFKVVNVVVGEQLLFFSSESENGGKEPSTPEGKESGTKKEETEKGGDGANEFQALRETQDQAWKEELQHPKSEILLIMEEAATLGVTSSPKGLGPVPEYPSAIDLLSVDPILMPPVVSVTPAEEEFFASASAQSPAAHHGQIQSELESISFEAHNFQMSLLDQLTLFRGAADSLVQTWDVQIQSVQNESAAHVDLAYINANSMLTEAANNGYAQIKEASVEGKNILDGVFNCEAQGLETLKSQTEAKISKISIQVEKQTEYDIGILTKDLDRVSKTGFVDFDKNQKTIAEKYDWKKYKGYSYGDHTNATFALEADVINTALDSVVGDLKTKFRGMIGSAVSKLRASSKEMAKETILNAVGPLRVQFETDFQEIEINFHESFSFAKAHLVSGAEESTKAVKKSHGDGVSMLGASQVDAQSTIHQQGQILHEDVMASGEEFKERIEHHALGESTFYPAFISDLQGQFDQVLSPIEYQVAVKQLENARSALHTSQLEQFQGLDEFYSMGEQDLQKEIDQKVSVFYEGVAEQSDQTLIVSEDAFDLIDVAARGFGDSLIERAEIFQIVLTQGASPLRGRAEKFIEKAQTVMGDFQKNFVKTHFSKVKTGLTAQLLTLHLSLDKVAVKQSKGIISNKKSKINGSAVKNLHDAMESLTGTDEKLIHSTLRDLSPGEIEYVQSAYDKQYKTHKNEGGERDSDCGYVSPLWFDIWDEMDGDDYRTAIAYLEHDRETALRLELEDSIGFFSDDEENIENILKSCSNEEITSLAESGHAQKALNAVGGVDYDVITALLNTELSKKERHITASSIRLYEAMDGLGTDEERVKEILEKCNTEEDRAMLRSKFQAYSNKKNLQNGESLDSMIEGDFSGTDESLMLSYASVVRDEMRIRVGKVLLAGLGAGTNEKVIFEMLSEGKSNEDYAKEYAGASSEDRIIMAKERLQKLDLLISEMSKKNLLHMDRYSSLNSFLGDELGEEGEFYYEVLRGENRVITSSEESSMNFEREVADRIVKTGKCEPDLMLRCAVSGKGNGVDLIKLALSKGGSPLPKDVLATIQSDYKKYWGGEAWEWSYEDKKVEDVGEEALIKDETLRGDLFDKLSGRDWQDVKTLIFGIPTTPADCERKARLAYEFATSGAVGSYFMQAADYFGLTNAHSDLEAQYERFNGIYETLSTKEKLELLTGENKGDELAAIAEYVSADARAYVKVKSTFVDIIILAHEVVAAAALTFCTWGGSSPLLVAVLTELAIGVAGIVTRELVMGDAYGSDDAIQDFGTALAAAMTAGAAEIKALGKIADSISGIGGKIVGAFSEGAADHGFDFAAKSLKLTEASIQKFAPQGILEVGQGVAGAAAATGVQAETWKDNEGFGNVASSVLKAIPQNIVSSGTGIALGGNSLNKSRTRQAVEGAISEVTAESVNSDVTVESFAQAALGGAGNLSKPGGRQKQDGSNSSPESFRKSPEEYVSDPDSVGRKKAELAPDLLPQKLKKEDQDALEVKLRKALPDDLKSTKLSVDLALPSNEVRVCYKINKMGLLTDIHVKTGPKATIRDIELHSKTIVLMKRYSGFTGRIRKMSNDYKAWRNGNKTHPLASMAWEANLELDKLPGIIEDRLNRLEDISLNEKHRIALEGEIKNLEGQIEKYKLLENDITEGRGYVAMLAKNPSTEQFEKAEERKKEYVGSLDTETPNIPAGESPQSFLNGDKLTPGGVVLWGDQTLIVESKDSRGKITPYIDPGHIMGTQRGVEKNHFSHTGDKDGDTKWILGDRISPFPGAPQYFLTRKDLIYQTLDSDLEKYTAHFMHEFDPNFIQPEAFDSLIAQIRASIGQSRVYNDEDPQAYYQLATSDSQIAEGRPSRQEILTDWIRNEHDTKSTLQANNCITALMNGLATFTFISPAIGSRGRKPRVSYRRDNKVATMEQRSLLDKYDFQMMGLDANGKASVHRDILTQTLYAHLRWKESEYLEIINYFRTNEIQMEGIE